MFVKIDGEVNRAPVPGFNVKLTDHAPNSKVDVVSKVIVVEFHNEMLVPLGTAENEKRELKVLPGDACNGFTNRLLPIPKVRFT